MNKSLRTYVVRRDGDRNIRFEGEDIGYACTSADSGYPNYSGSPGRCTELILYRTARGRYVCQRVEKTYWQGESDSHYAAVLDDEEAVFEFFGASALAKELYDSASLEFVEDIE